MTEKPKLAIIDRNDKERWPDIDKAFNGLPGGPEAYNKVYCETWQYMGTVLFPGANRWVHQFRHRAHPSNNERTYLNIPSNIIPDQSTVWPD